MKAVVDEALAKYGRLDIMFANAGIVGAHKHFTEIQVDEFMQVMRTNVLRCDRPFPPQSRSPFHAAPRTKP